MSPRRNHSKLWDLRYTQKKNIEEKMDNSPSLKQKKTGSLFEENCEKYAAKKKLEKGGSMIRKKGSALNTRLNSS